MALSFVGNLALGQQGNDTIRVGGIVIGQDTLPHMWIREVYIRDQAPHWLVSTTQRTGEFSTLTLQCLYRLSVCRSGREYLKRC